LVVDSRIDPDELRRLTRLYFGDMVKIVAAPCVRFMSAEDRERLRACYERILALVDLSVQADDSPTRSESAEPAAHADAFACLLRFTPGSAAQIPFVLPAR
jgi:hypothetical protein